ncbi:hypothetical protein V7147_23145 [Bacillus sp. JJ1521]|uniref:hypothetical protein n=1 Tax=Bacillus sp. JJ1521 TaxID=3122957 RepID=UPI002FFFA661
MKIIFFSIATASQLPRVFVLARSLKRHHPNSKFVLLLLERTVHLSAEYSSFIDEVKLPKDIKINEWVYLLFAHSSIDVSGAFKGHFFKYLLEKYPEGEIIVHVDPDMYALGPFDELVAETTNAPIVLVPHLLEPSSEGEFYRELLILLDGVFHSGLIAVKNCKESKRFSSWWGNLSLSHVDDMTAGNYMDQKWLSYAPNFFDTAILYHPGYFVASWNLHERGNKLIRENGGFMLENVPLRCFGFHNINGIFDRAIQAFSNDENETLKEIIFIYQQELRWMDCSHFLPEEWGYGYFGDETKISDKDRLKYRESESLRHKIPNPFLVSAKEFRNGGI